ncbi:hypothetical protein [Bradyrhizobium betae]|uniref:DUF1835 domain-containing protein n=1 Tax=Bradyrhizobium betae TaxID=244734 RepID=A0A5P6PC15_9BRAD|nr:hypothetical protein [Bradyrhizobium betae]MCS3729987.1 hypothetical protein [Bradyrhizobium betae]QFI75820.1 hypothetical protein F8237_27525 [Bradyrhizobium betae]
MTKLIVTTDSSIAGAIQQAGLADLVIAVERRLVWGRLPSDAELDAFFAPRTTQPRGLHWLDDTPSWRLEESGATDRGFIELLGDYDAVEFWRGPEPNAQLILLWLLDYWRRRHDANPDFVVRSLFLGVRDVDPPRDESYPPVVGITPRQLKSASRAWGAYCAPTPESWRGLFKTDLHWLPQLAHHAMALLQELPRPDSGLGATELRILQLIARGGLQPFDVFPGRRKQEELPVYGYWEVGELLDGLARCDRPAVAGLDEGPFSLEMHNDSARFDRYKRSQLSLTAFGKAVLEGAQNFRRHNRIDRWWGGTHLTDERLWQWDNETRALVAPE